MTPGPTDASNWAIRPWVQDVCAGVSERGSNISLSRTLERIVRVCSPHSTCIVTYAPPKVGHFLQRLNSRFRSFSGIVHGLVFPSSTAGFVAMVPDWSSRRGLRHASILGVSTYVLRKHRWNLAGRKKARNSRSEDQSQKTCGGQ